MVELLSHSLSRMFHNISNSIEQTKDHLSALDGAIGDADHGVTMSIGFQAVKAELSRRNVDAMAPADLMDTAAMAFLNSVGASTGPLYATGMRRAAQALVGAVYSTPELQAAIVKGIADGVRERGKGQRGDKTMLDAWIPASEAGAAAVRRSANAGEMWREIIASANQARMRRAPWWRPRDGRRDWANGRLATSIPGRRARSSFSVRWR